MISPEAKPYTEQGRYNIDKTEKKTIQEVSSEG